MTTRRYDIDWLRVIAIGLLLIYHIAISFQSWGVYIQFIQNNEILDKLWIPMTFLNVWRIPLLFFVSGMGVYYAIKKRDWKQLLKERSQRILLPYIFGIIAIIPLHILLFQDYYEVDLSYSPHPGHLWFLGNIFCYVLIFAPLFFYLKRNEKGKIHQLLGRFFSNPLSLLVIAIPFALEAYIVNPKPFEMYAMTSHGFFLGMLAFFFGFLFTYSGESFWKTVLKWRWTYLLLALGLYTIRFFIFNLNPPSYMISVESNLWILVIFGFGFKHLNHSSKVLTYLSGAAYPVYILHMLFLFLTSYLIFPMDISVWYKFLLVVLFTFAGCIVSYELLVKKIAWIRPLFGLKKISE